MDKATDVGRVLLIIGGGIAAYKSLELIRLMRKSGLSVRVVLTKSAHEFVTPLSCAVLSEDKVYSDLFDLKDENEMGHIELSRQADLVLVAPATADLMAKCAQGLANDLASTLLLATNKPVLMAPAMNVRMWHHFATQKNVANLQDNNITLIGPDEGEMACGEFGLGRMSEPEAILHAVLSNLNAAKSLVGKHIVITAGPTFEPLDPVRGLTNRSSGKQGFAIAERLARAGAKVTLISGPVALTTPQNVTRIDVETAIEMYDCAQKALPFDVFIGVAAVADWRAKDLASQKQKKNADEEMQITLIKNPDILAMVGHHKTLRPRLVIGFAAETEGVEAYGKTKLSTKGCDLIYACDVTKDVFGTFQTTAKRIEASGVTDLGRLQKTALAEDICTFLASHFS